MISDLRGMVEIPEFRKKTHICIHDNNICEDYPPHWHSAVEILMPIENNYVVIVNNERYEVKPYEILFIASEVIHSTIAPPTGRRYFFQIDESKLKGIAGVNAILPFVGDVSLFTPDNSPEIHRKLVKLYEEICDEYFDSEIVDDGSDNDDSVLSEEEEISIGILCEPIIYGKFLTMLALIGKKQMEFSDSDNPNQIKKKEYLAKIMTICRYIDEHFTEEITLDEVASRMGYSKFHFSRIFKQFTNLSYYKYVNQQRITYASELLANTNMSISKIAIQSGFSSTSAFIRMFKQIKNCTPTDFRELKEDYSFGMNMHKPKPKDF